MRASGLVMSLCKRSIKLNIFNHVGIFRYVSQYNVINVVQFGLLVESADQEITMECETNNAMPEVIPVDLEEDVLVEQAFSAENVIEGV